MDKIAEYKAIARQIVTTLAAELQIPTFENMLITYDERGQYLFFMDGWRRESRQYGCIVHLEVKLNGRVWVHRDGTDLDVGQQLVDANIPKNDIVLGFQSPAMREYGEFAVA